MAPLVSPPRPGSGRVRLATITSFRGSSQSHSRRPLWYRDKDNRSAQTPRQSTSLWSKVMGADSQILHFSSIYGFSWCIYSQHRMVTEVQSRQDHLVTSRFNLLSTPRVGELTEDFASALVCRLRVLEKCLIMVEAASSEIGGSSRLFFSLLCSHFCNFVSLYLAISHADG